ncbi:MAG: CcdC protein domain-containing protein, partial [bacterium]
MMNEEVGKMETSLSVSAYLASIGRKGGKRSRRHLSVEEARNMVRVRETRRAVTPRSILIPPVAMSTGMLMFVVPQTRPAWPLAVGAFAAGVLLF